MGVVKTVMKAAAVGLAIGTPVAITAFEVIGGPATVSGSSMQVKKIVVKIFAYQYAHRFMF